MAVLEVKEILYAYKTGKPLLVKQENPKANIAIIRTSVKY